MLTRELASTIVKETSLRLNRNINIMNDKGIIIASLDDSRIDVIHEGALEVLKNGQTLTISAKDSWKGAQPGINLPINFQGNTIGVIGITGAPEDLGDLGKIVKMTTELMINQEYIASQLEWQQRMKDMIIEELVKDSPSIIHIDRGLELLEITFQPPFFSLLIHINERLFSSHHVIQKIEEAIGKNKGIAGFISMNRVFIAFSGITPLEAAKKATDICNTLKKLQLSIRLAYSTPFDAIDHFSQSYVDCDLALAISDPSRTIVSFSEIESKALIYQMNKRISEDFHKRIMNETVIKYKDTLQCFFKNNFHIQKTADELFIHKNTLIYRLKKIEDHTGYQPKTFKDALTLQIALWIAERLKKEESGRE